MGDWRKIVFAVCIALIFIPMVYLGINTFFPDGPENNCYYARPAPVLPNQTAEEYKLDQQETRECENTYQKEREAYDSNKYIALMIICLIASLAMLIPLDKSVIYGLFFGVVITAFSGTLAYMESKSMIGFGLLVGLFIIVIAFVQRERKKGTA